MSEQTNEWAMRLIQGCESLDHAKEILVGLSGRSDGIVAYEALSNAIVQLEPVSKYLSFDWAIDQPLPIINEQGFFLRWWGSWSIGVELPVRKKLLLESLFGLSEVLMIIDHVENFYYFPFTQKVVLFPKLTGFATEHYGRIFHGPDCLV